MNKAAERLYNGIVKENPTLVLMLGMCPTMAVTTKAVNGLGMGLTTMAVLALSNLIISLLRKIIPNRVRIPAFIVIIASFVTILQLLLQAYLPWLYTALGVYIPLIVVNCIILGRAESYAYSNPPIPSLFDGVGMGLGFTLSLTIIGALREILGSGTLFDKKILPAGFVPIRIFGLAPGAFFVMALLCVIQNQIRGKMKGKGEGKSSEPEGCIKDCASCAEGGCAVRLYDNLTDSGRKDKADKSGSSDEKGHAAMPKAPAKPEVKSEINIREMSDKVKLDEETVKEKVLKEIEKEEAEAEKEKEKAEAEKEKAEKEKAEAEKEKAEAEKAEAENEKGGDSDGEH